MCIYMYVCVCVCVYIYILKINYKKFKETLKSIKKS